LLFGRDASRENSRAELDQFRREQGQLWLVDQDNTFGNSALQSDVQAMIDEFRRADCLIQAVDIAGLRVETDTTGMSANTMRSRLNDSQDALFYIADATGGNLFEDANNLGQQLESVLERSSVTYVLSFYPSDLKYDGAYHKLKVKADLPRGARLSHRTGYYAPRAYSELHPMEKALMASEAIASPAPRRELDLAMLAAAFRASADQAYVPVILEVGGRSLLDGHDAPSLDVELYVYATNSRGEMRDFLTQVVSFDLAKVGTAMGETGLKYYGHLDLTPDEYLIRVMVRNGQTGRTAVASQPLTVPRYEEASPEVLPPFFLEPPNRWLMVRERLAEGQESVIYPFMVKGEPFVPSARPAIRPGDGARFCLVGYNLGAGRLELEAQVIGDEGVPHDSGSLALIERTPTESEGVEKLLATFDPENLRAGEYTLEVAITNLDTGLAQQSSIPFVVN
ncbi:MAG: VWA domain-containing protein, partial [Holophagales bacterium]|nr:VWA domain-containing protein [Holophagales bacterium]